MYEFKIIRMINFLYYKKIFITTLFISVFSILVLSVNNEKQQYTLVLSPKIYNFDNEIYICSNPTDIMFSSYYAIQAYLEKNEYPQKAIFNSNNRKWLKSYSMNFILLKEKFSIFPLSNRAIEINLFGNKKINQSLLIKNIEEILKNLKNGNYFKDHIIIMKDMNLQPVPGYKILRKDELDVCKEFINIVFEKHKKIEENLVYIFIILFLSVYIFIFSIYRVIKSRIFN